MSDVGSSLWAQIPATSEQPLKYGRYLQSFHLRGRMSSDRFQCASDIRRTVLVRGDASEYLDVRVRIRGRASRQASPEPS